MQSACMATRTDIEPQTQKQVQPHRMLISAADYQRMGEAGIFVGKPRVELIDGEILTMTPISANHSSHVAKATTFFAVGLLDKAIILPQSSVRVDDYSEPEPDIAILKYKEDYYNTAHATPADILLLIEVAVESVNYDRTVKLEKYALAGIPEYWIIIPEKGLVEVYRHPEEGVFREKATYRKEDAWRFEAFDLAIQGSDLLI